MNPLEYERNESNQPTCINTELAAPGLQYHLVKTDRLILEIEGPGVGNEAKNYATIGEQGK